MITLVLGGARSGKSALAEDLAGTRGPVTYVATGVVGDDLDFARRVDEHRRRRPSSWTTVECGGDLVGAIERLDGPLLIDSLGSWLAAQPEFCPDGGLVMALGAHRGDVVVVSDEVGLGVHPETAVGRAFRDALGELNQAVAQRADRVLLVVAGCALTLKSPV